MDAGLSLWARYWSLPVLEVNLLLFANLFGALLLGLLVGYERSYHSRAAGMRTYGIVCMASCALTVFAGYPGFWWGQADTSHLPIDPTRVVQGIVAGVGFLCAGTILKTSGDSKVRGLTTAAGLWLNTAVGVCVGLGHEATAVLGTLLALFILNVLPKIIEEPRQD